MEKKYKRPIYKVRPETLPQAQHDTKPEAPKKKKGCGCGGHKKRINND
ncbi:hypothetical protein [Neobacillus piezotolerans]|nr:hypothetical protein [Neobacillus piezotolerans]